MSSAQFESAVTAVKGLRSDPGAEVKLRLYALYKQATAGDVSGGRPGRLNAVARAKFDAWSALSETSTADAEAQYVAIAAELTAAPEQL